MNETVDKIINKPPYSFFIVGLSKGYLTGTETVIGISFRPTGGAVIWEKCLDTDETRIRHGLVDGKAFYERVEQLMNEEIDNIIAGDYDICYERIDMTNDILYQIGSGIEFDYDLAEEGRE